MKGGSLKRRLLFGSAAAACLVWALSSAALYLLVRSHLYGELDQTLGEQAQHVAGLVEYDKKGLDLEFGKLDEADYSAKEARAYYTLRDGRGRVLATSPSLRGEALAEPGKGGASWTQRLSGGSLVRVREISFVPDHEDGSGLAATRPLFLAVGRSTAPVRAALHQLLLLLGAIWGIAVFASIAVLSFVVSRGLRPATVLAERIESIDPTAVGARIELPGAPAELAPVVRRLNDLLDRTQAALAREKSFLGAAAHELRTPLAGLRATLEVALSRTRSASAYADALRRCEEVAERMQARLDALLGLARLDSGQTALLRGPVDVRDLLQDAYRPLRERAERAGLSLSLAVPERTAVLADAGKLRMVFDNLFDNAVSHSGEPGTIEVRAGGDADTAVLTMTNPGCRLSPEALSHVFDRFFRGDAARNDESGHLGLGLSLCKDLVERMGGGIRAFAADGRFGLSIRLPRARASASQPLEAAS